MNKLLRHQKGQSLTEVAIGFGLLALLVLAIWVVIGPAVSESMAMAVGSLDLSNGHAADKHGAATIEAINKCFEQNGSAQTFVNRNTGRRAEICKTADGPYAVRIIEKKGDGWRVVSQFLKEKMKTLNDVARYLGNTGYDPLQ